MPSKKERFVEKQQGQFLGRWIQAYTKRGCRVEKYSTFLIF